MGDRDWWWWRLLLMARPRAGAIGLLLLLSLLGVGLNLLKPWPLKLVVDYVLPGKPLPPSLQAMMHLPGAESREGLLAWLTASTVLAFLLGWATSVVERYVQIDTGGRLTYGLAAQAFSHLQRLSLTFHSRQPTGDLVKRVAVDSRCIQTLVMDVAVPGIVAVVTLVTVFAISWQLNPTLALASLLVIPLLALLLKVYAQPMMDREYEQANAQGDLMAHAERVLTGLPIIQAFGREDAAAAQFVETAQRVGRSYLRNISVGLQYRVLSGTVIAAGTALLVALGGQQALAGRILLGDLLIFLSYVAFLYAPLETIAYLATSYASAAAGAHRVRDLIASGEHVHEVSNAERMPSTAPGHGITVRFEDVSFGYEAGREVLHHVTFAAAAGETIALVGPTGAGKTTVVGLLLRLFDPDEGRITFDGQDIRQYQLASLRERVSIVLQDPFMLPMSVAENIAYARPDAARHEVIAAARDAHAEEFIEQMPNGYETVLGERGTTLSGGQRQRLAIARAFLKDAPILILDEPTSALDTITEALVLDATHRLTRGRTTFIIGHRLSTVLHADRIVVLDSGRIVESGTHNELVTAGGLYSRLYAIQRAIPES